MSVALHTSSLQSVDVFNKRLLGGVLLSILLHGMLLSLRFGVPDLGLPGWRAPSLRVALSGLPDLPGATVVPSPAPERAVTATPPASDARETIAAPPPVVTPNPSAASPVAGFILFDPVAPTPVGPPPAVTTKSVTRKTRRAPSPFRSPPPRVIALDRVGDTFTVPLAPAEEAVPADGAEGEPAADELPVTVSDARQIDGESGTEAQSERVAVARREAALAAREVAEASLAQRRARELAEQEEVQDRAQRQKAQQLAQQQKMLEEAERQTAQQLAQQQKAREEVERQTAQQLAQQRKTEELATLHRTEELARQERDLDLARRQEAQASAQQRKAQELAEQQKTEAIVQRRQAEELVRQKERKEQESAQLQKVLELAERQAQELAQREKAQELARQRKAQELLDLKQAQDMALRQKEQELAQQQIAQERKAQEQKMREVAAQRLAEESLAREQAAARREHAVPSTPAVDGAGRDAAFGPDGTGGSGNTPKKSVGVDLGGRARDQLKGLDLLSGVPPMPARQDDPQRQGRRALVGSIERDVPLRMYVDSWRQKIERNGNMNYSKLSRELARNDPVVSVAIRSDGSVEEITVVRSSGRADLDEAVRRIVRVNARYAAFPPNIAAKFDVIEIRRAWNFDETLKIVDEPR